VRRRFDGGWRIPALADLVAGLRALIITVLGLLLIFVRSNNSDGVCGPMKYNGENKPKVDLATRLFNSADFAILWCIFLMGVLVFVSFPIRNVVLVCWVYGCGGYFHDGIRVHDKFTFSNGESIPTIPDMVTGFGAFIVTAFGLTFLLIFALRSYERLCGGRRDE
jgi:hypothetical protein